MSDAPGSNVSQSVADALAQAQAEAARAEARKNVALAREAEAKAGVEELKLLVANEQNEERLTKDKYQRIYTIMDPISEASVKAAIEAIKSWSVLTPGCDITLRIYSPGGDVIAGMYLYDFLMGLRRKGHKVITEAYGYAASMGGIILQAGDVRRCGAEAYILIHEIAFGVRGKVGEVEDEMEFVKKISDRVLDIFARRAAEAGANGTAEKPLTKAQFKHRWSRKDWWLTSDEALKFGVVDEVI